jgi:hypothetical protein
LLVPLFAALAEDGDIRRDAATASALRRQPLAALCRPTRASDRRPE